MVTKFTTFAHKICHTEMMNYCLKKCIYFLEYKKQVQFLQKNIYNNFLCLKTLPKQDISLIRDMYVFNKKKKVYTLKQNPTLRQVLSLYTILYPALRRGVTPVYTFQNKLIVKEAVDFIITTIKELSFIEQHILFLYVSFVSQKKISSLLKLSEPKVTQRKRRIENFFTRKVNDFYGVSGQNNNCISLKILREVDYFRSCYFSYLKKTGFKGFSKKK